MPTLLIINDTTGLPNWGGQATAAALQQIMRDEVPDAEIKLLSHAWMNRSYWSRRNPLGGTKVIQTQKKKNPGRAKLFAFEPMVADEFESVANEWMSSGAHEDAKEYIALLSEVDAVIFNAEGAVYRTNRQARKGLFMLWLAKTKFDVPAFFVNGSITLTRVDPVLQGMMRKTFSVIDGVAVREPVSYRSLKEYVPDAEANVFPDAVFYFGQGDMEPASKEYEALRSRLGDTPYFCLSPSMLPMDYSRGPSESAVLKVVQELKRVVPQAVLMAKDRMDQFLEDIAERTDSIYFGPEYGYWDQMRTLEGASFMISGRYHHNIHAVVMGCPCIPLTTTSHKIEGLCEMVDNEIGPPFDATDLKYHLGEIADRARGIVEAGEAKRHRLLVVAEHLQDEARGTGRMVHGVLAAEAVA
ncbi:MAG: polysaccharide pyruvyl transferase family protein [Bacteroidota bacterium]